MTREEWTRVEDLIFQDSTPSQNSVGSSPNVSFFTRLAPNLIPSRAKLSADAASSLRLLDSMLTLRSSKGAESASNVRQHPGQKDIFIPRYYKLDQKPQQPDGQQNRDKIIKSHGNRQNPSGPLGCVEKRSRARVSSMERESGEEGDIPTRTDPILRWSRVLKNRVFHSGPLLTCHVGNLTAIRTQLKSLSPCWQLCERQ
ncbi:hypothetical protein CRG98_038573 [Punica granatum]|uniref:Uncharacterized protein n=1 Tax=Punica granatum TaxID=22663 RepID=A0A2I0IAL7_PUNGR|nr:hypothetical protein CRG98_038573 [Punica granatum]